MFLDIYCFAALLRVKPMSRKNLYDTDFDLEYSDEIEDLDQPVRSKPKNQARRRIENILERKRLKKMISLDDDYWDAD